MISMNYRRYGTEIDLSSHLRCPSPKILLYLKPIRSTAYFPQLTTNIP